MPQNDFLAEDICNGGVFAIRNTLGQVKWALQHEPERALDTTFSPRRQKEALFIDEEAEDQFLRALKREYNNGLLHNVEVYGEESIKEETDFTDRDGYFALADMIDGTDLMERNLSNWCSAVVFFKPQNEEGSRIIASCVGVPSGKIYYAHADDPRVFYKHPSLKSERVGGPSSITKLNETSICFYGQKASRLKEVAELKLLDHLASLPQPEKGANRKKNRIYTLAGIPMMIKLIDHQVKNAANIDVIFEVGGQLPHDVVAGLYIAKKAGATVFNLNTGNELTDVDLEKGLMRPGHEDERMKYVVTATRDLCMEILPLLSKVEIAKAAATQT